jgi:precorrin-6A/cobalt-precorrin-6A reductase
MSPPPAHARPPRTKTGDAVVTRPAPSPVLILGGTSEARRLAERLVADHAADVSVITSLAGRTSAPARLPGAVRVGGFGGAAGLAGYLMENRVAAMVDATHPYAARMGWNAAAAARRSGVPLLRLDRPAWEPEPGDDWRRFESIPALAAALPSLGTHALITLGGADLDGLLDVTGIALTIRSIDAPVGLGDKPWISLILDRGPFDLDGEVSLLSARGIDVLVSRNAGGAATVAKLIAARRLGIPVAMLARPDRPRVETAGTVEDAARWVARRIG